ncbi:MAG: hypothetical protein KJ971_06340 [Firmicutes bacterium]|nr:hypothetical protein [Bacillota bacterium]
MAQSETKLQKDIHNQKIYEESLKTSFTDEMKFYDEFFHKISAHASTHRQITLNNLNDAEERLDQLKIEASNLKEALFYHDETAIVDRQEIISETEASVHEQNEVLLHHDRLEASEILDTIDYLNKALIQVKSSFFETYQRTYLNNLYNTDKFFDFFTEQSSRFQKVLDQHQEEIMDLFLSLNEEIKGMDSTISEIIQKKNQFVKQINRFYEQETKHYVDNQLLFSAEDDPTSIDIQALVSDKINQFEAFKKHLFEQDLKIEQLLVQDYKRLYQNIYERLLNRKSNLMTGDIHFFKNPEKNILELKEAILNARNNKNFTLLKKLISQYDEVKHYHNSMLSCQAKAKKLVKKNQKEKREYLLLYRFESNKMLNQLEEYLVLYQRLMTFDPFLAQTIGEFSSKIIKDELTHLSILEVNKELKTNINYDIESLKVKNKINEIEQKLIYEVKKHLLLQEIKLLDIINQIQFFLIDRKIIFYKSKQSITKERFLIERLDAAMNYHLEYLQESGNINRKWQSLVSLKLIQQIRNDETHNIHVVEAASKVKLALKEYDMTALHFKTMHETEMAYLIMQSSRVEEETKIHHEFILTTYLNQMRFSKEQIELAESEYRIRVESLMQIIDEEKSYFEDIIQNTTLKASKMQKQIEDEYQALLYKNTHFLSENTDVKISKLIHKEMEKISKQQTDAINKIHQDLAKNETILTSKRKIQELDVHLDDALKDAENLRNDTIQEMTDSYQDAKNHYEALKPYLESKVNILDPSFYNTLEKMNDRYHYKLKVAEIEIDVASKDLLDQYLSVYFEDQPIHNQAQLLAQIDEITLSRDTCRTEYAQKMQKLEDGYKVSFLPLDEEIKAIDADASLLKETAKIKEEATVHSIQYELTQLEKSYLILVDKHQIALSNQIDALTNEYKAALVNNQKYTSNLSSEFEKLLHSYKPYLTLSKKNPTVSKLFKEVHMAFKAKQKWTKKQSILKYKNKITFN